MCIMELQIVYDFYTFNRNFVVWQCFVKHIALQAYTHTHTTPSLARSLAVSITIPILENYQKKTQKKATTTKKH